MFPSSLWTKEKHHSFVTYFLHLWMLKSIGLGFGYGFGFGFGMDKQRFDLIFSRLWIFFFCQYPLFHFVSYLDLDAFCGIGIRLTSFTGDHFLRILLFVWNIFS
jgi:hypothetical protein